MSTIKEIMRNYSEKIRLSTQALQDEECEVINLKLKELNLDKRVKRVSDGKLGILKVLIGWDYGVEIKFYPFRKDKALSQNASGYCWEIEKEFEPAPEGDTK